MEKGKFPFPAYIVVAIVRCDIFLVQITIMCHRVPAPRGIPGNAADMIPVTSGTGIVDHVVWADLGGMNEVTAMQE